MYIVQNWSEGGEASAQMEELLTVQVYLIVALLCMKF